MLRMKAFKILTVMILSMFALMASAYADPITVSNVEVQENGGDYVVLVSLDNANTSSGVYTSLVFTIEELGTSKDVGVVTIDSNETVVLLYNLVETTDNFDLLKKGSTYTLTVETDFDSGVAGFLFGSLNDNGDGLDMILEEVEVNNDRVTSVDTLQVMNGETLEVDMRFSALENFDNARIMVFVEGYEHSPIVGSTDIFSVIEGKTYIKSVSVDLPSDMRSEQDYTLRIIGANDLSGLTYKEFTLYVDTERDRVDVLDLVMTPSSGVEPGQNIIANVRMKNRGQQEQDSVKVSVEIPSLNVAESSYVSNLDANEVATSDDMLLFIPEDAQAGVHNVVVKLEYNDGYTQSLEGFTLSVLSPKLVEEKNLLVSFNNNVDLKAGQANSFDIVIANPNEDSKPISIAAADNSWADVDVEPSLVMIQGGSSATFTVTVTPKSAVEGEKTLTLVVKEGSETVSEVPVSTYVEEGNEINWLNVALAVLLIIAIIILLALVVTIAKRKNEDGDRDEDEVTSTEEYY